MLGKSFESVPAVGGGYSFGSSFFFSLGGKTKKRRNRRREQRRTCLLPPLKNKDIVRDVINDNFADGHRVIDG